MRTQTGNADVKNLCSRKLLELLQAGEWRTLGERLAIRRELQGRRHYLQELASLEGAPATGQASPANAAPTTAKRH